MRLRTARLDYRFGYRGRRDRPRGSHGDGCAGRPGMGLGRCPGRESRRRSWSAHGYQDPHPRSALRQRVTSMNLFGTVIRVTPSYGATIGMEGSDNQPLRGIARRGLDPAGWPRRGDRPAVAPLGARQGRGRPDSINNPAPDRLAGPVARVSKLFGPYRAFYVRSMRSCKD